MSHRSVVAERRLDRAQAAGERWTRDTQKRADAIRLLREGGSEAADSPARVERFRAREAAKQLAFARAGVTDAFFVERRVGPTLDLDDFPPNDTARLAGVSVARLVELDGRGGVVEGFATGFLVTPSLLITNHHVFAAASECDGCGAQFSFEKQPDGTLSSGVVFSLDASRFFYANAELDFAIVGVAPSARDGRPLLDFKSLSLIPATGKILVGQAISIIQYPDGGPKKYGVRDNELLDPPDDADLFLQYTTDTLPGSSGSPAFNKDWEVVALHHSGVPEIKNGQVMTTRGTPWSRGMPDSDVHWIANEGVRVSSICNHLSSAHVDPVYQPAFAELIRSFRDDMSTLPAIRSQQEGVRMESTVSGDRGVSIVVNGGTANVYVGGSSSQVAPQKAVQATSTTALPVTEKKLLFDPDYDHRPGYDKDFLDVRVPMPDVTPGRMGEILKENGHPHVLDYHHYSLVMNRTRRLVMWAAANVDYTATKRRKKREDFGTDTWTADPRIAANLQIEDSELYDPAKKFDRGHIVRRDDVAWGETAKEEVFANSDSFHWTNCTPQHEQFNRDMYGFHGLWGGLENQIQKQAKNVGNRMSIFAGPVLDDAHDIDHDFGGGLVKVPRKFWKVLIVTEDADSTPALRAFGFVLDQSKAIQDFGIERFSAGKFDVYQHTLQDISDSTGVVFAQALLDADASQGTPEESRRRPLRDLADIRGLNPKG